MRCDSGEQGLKHGDEARQHLGHVGLGRVDGIDDISGGWLGARLVGCVGVGHWGKMARARRRRGRGSDSEAVDKGYDDGSMGQDRKMGADARMAEVAR